MSQPPAIKRDELAASFGAPAERPEWALTEERIPLFSYVEPAAEEGGQPETVSVTMPAVPNPGLALRFLRQGRTIGVELAISWLIEETIGAEAYERLADELSKLPDPSEGPVIVQRIGQKIQQVVMGGLDGPKA